MKAVVIHARNPFAPMDREVAVLRRPARVRQLAPRGSAPVIALINGRPLMRAGWRRRMRDGDALIFVSLPRGGGGGGGGSNPMQALAMIALMAVAGPLATALTGITAGAAAAAGAASWTSIAFSATQAGIQMAGAALINAVLPQPRTSGDKQPSPTYTLTAQGNAARLEAPIPVQYGRLLSYPDFAAQPYTEFAGGEQYLYQLLCLGCGEYDIEEIRIEDTPIASFAEITYEVIPPGGDVTLFPTSVITSTEVSGQELAAAGDPSATWARSGSVMTVTKSGHSYVVGMAVRIDITSGGGTSNVYAVTGVTTNTFTVTTPAVGTSGACVIHSVVGGVDGFVASGAETVAHKIGVDMVLPSGLYHRATDGKLHSQSVGFKVQARQVDDLGLPVGAWIDLTTTTLTAKTISPLRKSWSFNLATPGRYRVRAWRSDERADPDDNADQILWSGLRAYLADPQDFGPVTLIAMKMRATNNLSLQSARKINVISTRKLPVWNGTSWSAPVATRSIAWALADAARNTDYGAKLADTRIDLAALLALDALWTARGDSFNGRFDSAASWWQAAGQIAAVGRAKPFMQGGILRVVRDGSQTVPVAHFGMRNIKRGSFGIDFILPSESTADAVRMVYFDESIWANHTVKAALPGSSVAKPVKVELFGATARAQVLREGLYHAACNKYRRTVVKFETEMEGFIPTYGDLISIQHDMPGWGAHAEAVAWNPTTRVLRLSEPMDFSGDTKVIGLRRVDGSLSGPWAVTAGVDAYEVILATAPDITPEVDGQDRERTHVAFGTSSTWRTLAKVIAARPRSLYDVEIEAVVEDPSVHTAETGVVAAPIRTSDLPRRVVQPVVSGLFAKRVPGDAIACVIGWRPAAGAEVYHVEMAEGDDIDDPDVEWTRVADVSNANYHATSLLHALRTMIRVRGQGLAAGPWVTTTIGSLIPDFYLSDDTSFWLSDETPFWSN